MTPQQALKEAIRRAGSRYKLARMIGLTSQAVYQWGEQAPVLRIVAIEEATGVSRYELRPDIYGSMPHWLGTAQRGAA